MAGLYSWVKLSYVDSGGMSEKEKKIKDDMIGQAYLLGTSGSHIHTHHMEHTHTFTL